MPKKTSMLKRSTKVKKFGKGRKSANIRQVHRRLVLFPDHRNSLWLKKLQWFAGVVMKFLTTVVGLTADGYFEERKTSAGTTIILGPGDFAAVSPYAVPVTTNAADREVKALKTFSFERAALHHVHIRIVPSADAGVRGGVYAALVVPIDEVDSQFVYSDEKGEDKHRSASLVVNRYSPNYEDILKHPRAKSGPVTTPLSLSIKLRPRMHNIRCSWDEDVGYVNAYPRCALLIGFSDLAASSIDNSDANYDPSKCLFEVHLRGGVTYGEPSEIVLSHPKTVASQSCYTPYILTTTRGSVNAKEPVPRTFQMNSFCMETALDRVHITDVPTDIAELAITEFARDDLKHLINPKLAEEDVADYQMI